MIYINNNFIKKFNQFNESYRVISNLNGININDKQNNFYLDKIKNYFLKIKDKIDFSTPNFNFICFSNAYSIEWFISSDDYYYVEISDDNGNSTYYECDQLFGFFSLLDNFITNDLT